jgi:hypothetical protein
MRVGLQHIQVSRHPAQVGAYWAISLIRVSLSAHTKSYTRLGIPRSVEALRILFLPELQSYGRKALYSVHQSPRVALPKLVSGAPSYLAQGKEKIYLLIQRTW